MLKRNRLILGAMNKKDRAGYFIELSEVIEGIPW
jgi:hypothetical protein